MRLLLTAWLLSLPLLLLPAGAAASAVDAELLFFRRGQHEASVPARAPEDARKVRRGFRWKAGRDWAWLLADLTIPPEIDGVPTVGKPVGVRISCASGGEVHVGGKLQVRYDNDKPALVILQEAAVPGQHVALAIQAHTFIDREDDNEFSEAEWVIVSEDRVRGRVELRIDPRTETGTVPDGIVGLSQGGTLADHDDATAAKLREGQFRWFRMDNALTNCVREVDGKLVHDFTDLDRRVDFIYKAGADPIIAASYMPQALDAIPDPERHSAPRDFALWEDLCFRAAKHSLERGKRIPFWEVWNEPNTGWLKPSPGDPLEDRFVEIYARALGEKAEKVDRKVAHMFMAYAKLYAATARGVRRADPEARVGGPALASGPFESAERGHARNGKGFARGLMLWCQEEKLPLDFVSWHEYFQPPDVFRAEADAFRALLDDFPDLKGSVKSFMVTEWNEAWWADPPQDNEIGAAWCANTITRAFLPAGVDRPCFFYVKQGDSSFRGDYALLLKDNVPKPQYHVAKIFNGLSGKWLKVTGDDGEVSCVAARDERDGRITIVLVNFTDRYNLRRHVRVSILDAPRCRAVEHRIDATHSNVLSDAARSELEKVREEVFPAGEIRYDVTLPPHAVARIELRPEGP